MTRHRDELSEFLKTRRARLSPAEVGLPAAAGRRSRGLRREDVAVLAGVGLTWYTWFEQGRDIQVSTPFLENLARGLRLSAAERAHLFALAQHRPPPLSVPAARTAAPDGLQAILDAIASPAFARNDRFDVVAWNDANTRMFGDFAAVPADRRNIVRRLFQQSRFRHTMPNWEADARAVLAKFRMAYGQAAGDEAFASLVRELLETSDDFRRMWAEHAVSDIGEGVTAYRSPAHGLRLFRHSTLVPEAFPDLRLVIYIANGSTE